MKNFFSPALCLVIVVCFSCRPQYRLVIEVPEPQPYPTPVPAQMIAGMGQADLTLPPGYPMSGYSIQWQDIPWILDSPKGNSFIYA